MDPQGLRLGTTAVQPEKADITLLPFPTLMRFYREHKDQASSPRKERTVGKGLWPQPAVVKVRAGANVTETRNVKHVCGDLRFARWGD